MNKSLSMLLALAAVFTLTVGCGNIVAANPDPDPHQDSISDAVEVIPVVLPVTVEGVVKGKSLGKIVITLSDGTDLTLNTTSITGIDVQIDDIVMVEYTEINGVTVANKVNVIASAEPELVEVTGTVKEVSSNMVVLTLKDEDELILNTEDIDSLDVKEGDIITAVYTNDGNEALATSVEVIEAAEEQEIIQDITTPVLAAGVQIGTISTTESSEITVDDDEYDYYYGDDYYDDYDDYDYYDDYDEYYDNDEDDYIFSNDSSNNVADVYEAVQLINAERAKQGIRALETNSDLMAMADLRAEELSVYFEHARPDGRSCWTVFDEFGSTLEPCGENAYWDRCDHTASTAINAWMNSPGHKANILNGDATKIGVGYYDSYWAMITAR